jgi:hypothetical protein
MVSLPQALPFTPRTLRRAQNYVQHVIHLSPQCGSSSALANVHNNLIPSPFNTTIQMPNMMEADTEEEPPSTPSAPPMLVDDPQNPFSSNIMNLVEGSDQDEPILRTAEVAYDINELISLEEMHDDLDEGLEPQEGLGNRGQALFLTSSAQEIEDSVQQRYGVNRKHMRYKFPPGLAEAESALQDIAELISPHRSRPGSKVQGHKAFKGSNVVLQRLLAMENHLKNYVTPQQPHRRVASVKPPLRMSWQEAGRHAAVSGRHKPAWSRKLCKWTQAYIADRNNVPFPSFGTWSHTMLEHGDLAKGLLEHLQSVGKYVKAQDIINYLGLPETKQRHGYDEDISVRTAQRWMLLMNYRWRKRPNGQYEDGHERPDVVLYRQEKFLPKIARWVMKMRYWRVGDEMNEAKEPPIWPRGYKLSAHVKQPDGSFQTKKVVVWFQDESTFYQNDRRHTYWVQDCAKSVPQPKGEGASCMVSDFVSADYGWLRDPDGLGKEARVLFKPGKNRDGYFTNIEVIEQAQLAMDICERYYPDDQHVFVFDNATTHTARPADAPSARGMTLNPSAHYKKQRNVLDNNGKPVYSSNGKRLKEDVRVADTVYNGISQSLYFPDNHDEYPGYFKGIAQILLERGDVEGSRKRLECKGFDCADQSSHARCCARRILFNQPDFCDQKSALELACEKRGFEVAFLPKFHPELNFIEQCWGYAKRRYREYPIGKSEDELESNVAQALNSIPLVTMRR